MPDDPTLDQPIKGGDAGDENAGADTDGADANADAEVNADATNTGDEDAGNGEGDEDGGGEKDPKDPKDAKAPPVDTSEDDDKDDDKEPEIRKRMSNKDYIIQRQQKKLSKKKDDSDDGDSGDTYDDITPEDEALVNRIVAKNFAPVIEKSLADDDNREVADFLEKNPDFKPFEAKVRRFMKHESRMQLPVKSIFYEVAGDKLMKIGAERNKKAEVEAKNSATGGGSNRAGEGSKKVADLTPEEFEAEQQRVRTGN